MINTTKGFNMFKNSKKQGDAGLGQAIAYFTSKGFDIALPLTDSADWDLVVEIDGILKKVQVKTSAQQRGSAMIFGLCVNGGNKSGTSTKLVSEQNWDLLFLYHLITKQSALIPHHCVKSETQLNLTEKYKDYFLDC